MDLKTATDWAGLFAVIVSPAGVVGSLAYSYGRKLGSGARDSMQLELSTRTALLELRTHIDGRLDRIEAALQDARQAQKDTNAEMRQTLDSATQEMRQTSRAWDHEMGAVAEKVLCLDGRLDTLESQVTQLLSGGTR